MTKNMKSTLVASSVILPRMLDRNSGKLIFITSYAGAFRWPHCSSYSSSKAAVNKLAENIGFEIKDENVQVFAYHPGFLEG